MVFVLILSLQADAARWITELGDDSLEVREAASERLLEMGLAACDRLREALRNDNAERRERARGLLEHLSQADENWRLEVQQRPLKLQIEKLNGLPPVDVQWREMTGFRSSPAFHVRSDGERFSFALQPFRDTGTVIGISVERFTGDGFEWDVAGVAGDRPVRFQTCARHSPSLIYVPGATSQPLSVTISGTRWWSCGSTVEFPDPKEGQHRRVGAYTVAIEWPWIVVRSDRAIPTAVLDKSLAPLHVSMKLKNETFRGYFGGRHTVVSRG